MYKDEIRTWKDLALYLADCHAATLSDEAMRKSTSNAGRQRFANICKIALEKIRDLTTSDMRQANPQALESIGYVSEVMNRTEKNIAAAEKMIAETSKRRVAKG